MSASQVLTIEDLWARRAEQRRQRLLQELQRRGLLVWQPTLGRYHVVVGSFTDPTDPRSGAA